MELHEASDYYLQLLEKHQWLGNGLSWTVVQPLGDSSSSIHEISSRLTGGGNPEARIIEFQGQSLYPMEVVFFEQHNGMNILLQTDGGSYASSPEVMHWLSEDARVWNVSWQMSGAGRFFHAVYGQTLARIPELNMENIAGADPGALADEIEPLRRAAAIDLTEAATLKEAWARKTAAMAVIELSTGVRLDEEWLSTPRSAFVIDQPVRVPLEPLAFGHFDPDLDARLRLAPEAVRREILLLVVRHLVERHDLDGELFASATEEVRHGGPLGHQSRERLLETQIEWGQEAAGPLIQEGYESDPERLRLAALTAIRHALVEAGDRAGRFHSLTYARHALGAEWPPFRATIRAALRLG